MKTKIETENKEMKTINIEAMKTRILATVLMIIATLGVIANPVELKIEDTLSTSHLAVISGSNDPGMVGNEAYSAYLPSGITKINDAGLEDWVENRENWERFDNESPVTTASAAIVNLDNWMNDRASWEQESSSYDLAVVAYFNNIEDWVSTRESWEQSVSGSDLARRFEGTVQQEWINTRESWEQK
jgi:hypothetical protein